MLAFRKPNPQTIQTFLDQQRQLGFTYSAVGATANEPPAGFVVDHTRATLGTGELVFAAARAALEDWQPFRTGWLEPASSDTPIEEGETVALTARALGMWWLVACRIVYLIDEQHPARRFGFAYGTLPGHAESGEERFLIEMDEYGAVWFDILAFSRPRHLLARIGYPFVRRLQKRFGRDSVARMKGVVQGSHTV